MPSAAVLREGPEMNVKDQAMIVDFPLPELGEQVSSATVTAWSKAVGDKVSSDELLLEVMTEKINVEVVSPWDGTLVEILKDVDEDVAPGVVVARIEVEGGN